MTRRMTGVAWLVSLLLLTATGAHARAEDKKIDLKVGDTAPAFESVDDEGRPWKSADHVGKKYIVLYFYPGDFTPGCIAQANAFRDGMKKLVAQGVEVVGVSGDDVASHQLFKKVYLLNFALLADEKGNLAKKFGVPVGPGGQVKTREKDTNGTDIVIKRGVTANRWTFLIGKDGKIALKNTKVLPAQDAKQLAEFIEKLGKR